MGKKSSIPEDAQVIETSTHTLYVDQFGHLVLCVDNDGEECDVPLELKYLVAS